MQFLIGNIQQQATNYYIKLVIFFSAFYNFEITQKLFGRSLLQLPSGVTKKSHRISSISKTLLGIIKFNLK